MAALIVETGAIIAGADAYVDVTYADTYHTNRGNAVWGAAQQTAKEAAIRVATQYLDGRYRNRFKGSKLQGLQPRQWPRYGVVVSDVRKQSTPEFDAGVVPGLIPSNVIPDVLKQATCEAALRALSGPLSPDLPRGGKVKRKKTDVLETEYMPGAPGYTVYETIELLIGDLLDSGNSTEIIRA